MNIIMNMNMIITYSYHIHMRAQGKNCPYKERNEMVEDSVVFA